MLGTTRCSHDVAMFFSQPPRVGAGAVLLAIPPGDLVDGRETFGDP